jgi:glyoxylase I family protein
MIAARYVHTNIIARDWQRLALFYTEVFGCELVPPARVQSGDLLARGTGVAGAALEGVHLRLPGHGDEGPTLEIYGYRNPLPNEDPSRAERLGLRHLAFAVENVREALDAVAKAGGRAIGEIVEYEVEGAGHIAFVYAADPEENIIELQRWD